MTDPTKAEIEGILDQGMYVTTELGEAITDQLVALVERREREARIDELNFIDDACDMDSWTNGHHNMSMNDFIERRIAQLDSAKGDGEDAKNPR